MKKDTWQEYQEYCLSEFNKKYSDIFGTKFLYADALTPDQLIEFSEYGDAYPRGTGGIAHVPNAVISFKTFLKTERNK